MQKRSGWGVALGVVLGLPCMLAAQEQPQAILERALKAHGAVGQLTRWQAVLIKAKGTLGGVGEYRFVSESVGQLSGQLKQVTDIDANGQKLTVITVFDGTRGWIKGAGQAMEMNETMCTAMKETAYRMSLNRFADLKEPRFTLTPLGETKISDRPVVGIKVSAKGHRDVNLYFDKQTGLLAKSESRTLDFPSGMEVVEETIIQEYQERNGYKAPKRMLTNHDGKKYLDAEILDYQLLDKPVDAKEFIQP